MRTKHPVGVGHLVVNACGLGITGGEERRRDTLCGNLHGDAALTASVDRGCDIRRKSKVNGNSGLRSSSGTAIIPGVCPMSRNRAKRRLSASEALTGHGDAALTASVGRGCD